MTDFSVLKGKTIIRIYDEGKNLPSPNSEVVFFETFEGDLYKMHHHQDCCEDVYLHDVAGDWTDLLMTPILLAEERDSPDRGPVGDPEGYTWTFYEIRTIKGSVTISWYGTSNGYYSEHADFCDIKDTSSYCYRGD